MSNYDRRVQAAKDGIAARMSWPSMHWGIEDVHPDAWIHIARAAVDALDKIPAEAGPEAPAKPWPTPRACQHQAVVSHTTNPPTHKCLTCKNEVVRKGVRWEST